MGFSTVFAGIVVLVVMFFVISVFLGILIETSMSSLSIIKATALKNKELIGTELEVISIEYRQECSCFIVSIINKGDKALVELKTLDILLSYRSNSSLMINELLRYNESWFPITVSVGNITQTYIYGRPLYPGETIVIETKQMDSPSIDYPLKVILATRSGFVSEKVLSVVIE